MASAPCASIRSSGSMPVPRLFDIRRPSVASTVEWTITSWKGIVADELEPRPDHPVLPEADDLARRRVHVARGSSAAGPRCPPASRAWRTARAPTRTTCRARPGRARARPSRTPRTPPAAATRRSRGRPGQYQIGQLVAPPELARDVPVGDLLERADRRTGAATRGGSARAARGAPRARASRGSSMAQPPLERDERLDAGVAALAGADVVTVGLALLEPRRAREATRRPPRRPPPASGPRARRPPRSSDRPGR